VKQMNQAEPTTFFAVKTTVGQEKSVARVIERRLPPGQENILSIVVLPDVRGYVFVEAKRREHVVTTLHGIRHVRSRPVMPVRLDEISSRLVERPIIDTLNTGDTVEITAGPLKGMSGKIVRVDRPKKEVTIELAESAFPVPISVPVDHVRTIAGTAGTK